MVAPRRPSFEPFAPGWLLGVLCREYGGWPHQRAREFIDFDSPLDELYFDIAVFKEAQARYPSPNIVKREGGTANDRMQDIRDQFAEADEAARAEQP